MNILYKISCEQVSFFEKEPSHSMLILKKIDVLAF